MVYSSMSSHFDKLQAKAVEEAAQSFQPPTLPRLDTARQPSADSSTSTLQPDILDDPVSRVSSPPHKVPGWAGRLTSTDVALDGQALGTVSQLESGQRLMVLTAMIGPPSEPTASFPKGNAGPETPRTPRTKKTPRSTTPPPLVPKCKLTRPQLLQALQKNSVEDVHSVLQHAPEAARELFWDHDVEPPLCCAVRLWCKPAIIKRLLEKGASPETKDMHGRTPAQILAQEAPSLVSPQGFSLPLASATAHVTTYETWSHEVAGLLGT